VLFVWVYVKKTGSHDWQTMIIAEATSSDSSGQLFHPAFLGRAATAPPYKRLRHHDDLNEYNIE